MSGIDERLTQQIDLALQVQRFDASLPQCSETLSNLFSAVGEYLAQPVPSSVRAAAAEVAAVSKTADLDAAAEARFRVALHSLRDAIDSQREQEEAASQLANDPELVQEFLVEAREHLVGVEAGMLTLERDPLNAEALNGVFRSFHTIKGLAAFLGASAIQELAHETESVLDLARSGHLTLSTETIDLILKSADELNRCLDKSRTMNIAQLPRCDVRLLTSLAEVVHPGTTTAPAASQSKPEIAEPPAEIVACETAQSPLAPPKTAPPATAPRVTLDTPTMAAPAAASPSVRKAAEAPAPGGTATEGSVVRIDTAKLEYLIDMVGELVIAESVVRHDPSIAGAADPLVARNLAQLARVVQEVQKTSMSMRMVAVGTLFRKMSRLTRDLARKCGKAIELVTVGDDVELDRSIVEELADPMVHMIRNAVDHGLENAADRASAGKSEQGTIRLLAMHDAGDIVIEISDDGRGMDPARILAKARRLGMVGEQDTPDEDAIFRFIFEPGFSTNEKVTDMSGRGVGMDVVKKQIQKLRGRVAIRSVLGKGCTFVLRLPLTLAIIDGLVVGVGSQRFILPMFAVREMFSPKEDTFVTLQNRAEAALFRDKLLPVIRLSRLFGSAGESGHDSVLVVVDGRDQLYCIAVDQLVGKQEVVIKSLGKTFRDVPGIAGGAILGDGRVGLIVDVNSLQYQN